MNKSFIFLFEALLLLASLLLFIRYVDSSRKKSLRKQAGITSIHGEAGNSLSKEKMRIRKTNREKGIVGELGIALELENLAKEYGLSVLHDLSIPGSKANIDHILVTRKIIYVIDSKNYNGEVKISKDKNGEKKLRVNGRDESSLVAKIKKYSDLVSLYLEEENIPVKVIPILAFFDGSFNDDSYVTVDGVVVNLFGIENELLRYANIKSPEIEIADVTYKLLGKFPPKEV